MMEKMNGGYVALAVIGVVFIGLQIWWISMTIRNGKNERVPINQIQIDEIRKRLEKSFLKK